MELARRPLKSWLIAAFQKKHYVAFFNMLSVCPNSFEVFRRYITNSGSYPYDVQIRTPLGVQTVTLYSYHDLLTVNEIFCRQDYRCKDIKVVLDIGANIGLSALYFLTRNAQSKVYLYEPVPTNVERLKKTLKAFEGRYFLTEAAVGDEAGTVEFAVEPSGRYGTMLPRPGDPSIQIPCHEINSILADILSREPAIDIIKLDTEGMEERTINAINPKYNPKIREILFEDNGGGGVIQRRVPAAVPA